MPQQPGDSRGIPEGNGEPEGLRATDQQAASEADQTSSDADQTSADADQASADADQLLSDREQNQAFADQLASDREQAASDQEIAVHPGDGEWADAHAEGRAVREASSLARDATALGRAENSHERAETAAHRDQVARARDREAEDRDREATARDQVAERFEQSQKLGRSRAAYQAAIKHAADARAGAAADRARAAADRQRAANDREQAAIDRHHALAELRRAHIDELTGAYRRGVGEGVMQQEMDRARRTEEDLVLAFIDVDDLKETNSRLGHTGGDELLQAVVAAIRSKMRSYEPIMRFGGDEFVCSFSGVDLEGARRRFDEIQEALGAGGNGHSVSIGLAAMAPEDDLADLIGRADAALIETRRQS